MERLTKLSQHGGHRGREMAAKGIKLGSLFDGSGGFPLAGSMCGITPVWASEVEPYPIAVTRSRFPDMKHLGSVTDICGGEIEPVDIITFGSPCQDLSIAGKRAGLKHEVNGDDETTRSGLFMEAIRIIKEMREATNGEYPKYALWENVPGAFSSNKGEDFRIVLEELIKIVEPTAVMPPVPQRGWAYADCYIGDGWSLAYRVFDAQHWGVPQRRRRIHLILDLTGQRAGKILFEREGLRGHFETFRTAGQETPGDAGDGVESADREGAVGFGINGDVAGTLDASYYIGWEEERACTLNADRPGLEPTVCCQYLFENHSQDSRYKSPLEVCPMLPAQLGTGGNNQPFVVHESYSIQGNTIDRDVKQNGGGVSENVAYTLNSVDRHGVVYCMAHGQANAEILEGVSPCLSCVHESPIVCGTFQNTGVGWWNESDVGTTVRTPCDGDATLANTVVEGSIMCCGVDCRNLTEHPELYPTLQAKPNGGQSLNYSGAVRVRYIVRRLTPTECARLQGFADRWGDIEPKESFTDAEYAFWLEVRNTHAAINGKAVKDYTKKQMLAWYNKLHTDSAEYKLWGNGIALPPALYCMQGIVEAMKEMHHEH